MMNENLKIRVDNVNSSSFMRTRSPAIRGVVHGVLLSLAIWTGAGSLLLMFAHHGGSGVQVTLANQAPQTGQQAANP